MTGIYTEIAVSGVYCPNIHELNKSLEMHQLFHINGIIFVK